MKRLSLLVTTLSLLLLTSRWAAGVSVSYPPGAGGSGGGGTNGLVDTTALAGATNSSTVIEKWITPPPIGSDATGNGSKNAPWASITNAFLQIPSNGYFHVYSGDYDDLTNSITVGLNQAIEGYGPTRPRIFMGAWSGGEATMFQGGTNFLCRYMQLAQTNFAFPSLVSKIGGTMEGTWTFDNCVVEDGGDALVTFSGKLAAHVRVLNTIWTIKWDGFQENSKTTNDWEFTNSTLIMSNNANSGQMVIVNSSAWCKMRFYNTPLYYDAPTGGSNGTGVAQFIFMGNPVANNSTNWVYLNNSPLINRAISMVVTAITISGTSVGSKTSVVVLNNSPEIPNLVNATTTSGCIITTNAVNYLLGVSNATNANAGVASVGANRILNMGTNMPPDVTFGTVTITTNLYLINVPTSSSGLSIHGTVYSSGGILMVY